MSNRRWEIWDKNLTNSIAKERWLSPQACLEGKGAKGGIHWQLIRQVASLVEGNSVLDVACGLGHLYILVKGKEYLGIDNSESMIEKCREYFPQEKDFFQVGDAYDLNEYPRYDTVTAVGLLLHLPDPEPVIKELWKKTLKCLILTAWIGDIELIKPTQIDTKMLIQRRDTKESLQRIFKMLKGLDHVEETPFQNPNQGESNYIFKLVRKYQKWKKSVLPSSAMDTGEAKSETTLLEAPISA